MIRQAVSYHAGCLSAACLRPERLHALAESPKIPLSEAVRHEREEDWS
jgi:hypothetical protein